MQISIHAEYIEITARQTALALDPPVPEEAAEEGETEEEVEAFAVIAMNSCQDYFTPVPSFFSSLCSTLCAIQDSELQAMLRDSQDRMSLHFPFFNIKSFFGKQSFVHFFTGRC